LAAVDNLSKLTADDYTYRNFYNAPLWRYDKLRNLKIPIYGCHYPIGSRYAVSSFKQT